ncbi:LLM class F420-dependent oxidoreductase [Parahaliea aestuarii]|uniref:LLM class F420-dependent oxidoreductase n=1 Tax=Parahaliea aestuarii TaxID=1852021 RepID=A0A5C8ZTL4_9GAMM|nr:LLM class F420-dependent oxidoreductase [Parahaliea aestuarii]TXS91796.1 LLM class F420-dependent oxidoreductase [Parahaliea aestuarii]
MKIGFSSMNTQFDPLPAELASALEERGFESLWMGEHSHIPVNRRSPYPAGGEMPEPYKHMRDPYVSLMSAAAVTSRLRLATGIALLMERDVFSLAKSIATLDTLSEGRVLIGTGVGWNREEFENVNRCPWDKRYGVMRETVAALRTLWTSDEPEFEGEHIHFDAVWSYPKPAQKSGPPILFGAMGAMGVRHSAQWADGWLPVDIALPDIAESIAGYRQLLGEYGRTLDDAPITLQCMVRPSRDDLLRYQDLGIDRVVVGVEIDKWGQADHLFPMIDEIGTIIDSLG